MISEIQLTVPPTVAAHREMIEELLVRECGVVPERLQGFEITKRSIDARGKTPVVLLRITAFIDEQMPERIPVHRSYKNVDKAMPVVIVGAGPAGYFAALELLEIGKKPIIIERGKTVRDRRRDLRAIQQFHTVHPDSNYCFGEGGAGTYSDGKLWTNSTKRGDIRKVLQILVEHGAQPAILEDAHPHIGSNKLPKVVEAIRETILQYGGEIHFQTKVTGIIRNATGAVQGVRTECGKEFLANNVILATGHSSRDIFTMLQQENIPIEPKPFALGIRIEHPQALIDEIQYKQRPREEFLPAASYKLVAQVRGRGVFSFCMCPGGLIVPAATTPGEIVVNGMSMSRRDSPYANSGIVVAVEIEDMLAMFPQQHITAGVALQQLVERTMFNHSGKGQQTAPAQRLTDFDARRISADLPDTSYIPGIYSAPMHELLPPSIAERLRLGFQIFGKKMKGYFTQEAVLVGTESRTSCPIRIPRNPETLEHPAVKGLYPCGEGAGYAGGIVSAALDGQRVARAIV